MTRTFYNGRIFTMGSNHPIANYLTVSGDRIKDVGWSSGPFEKGIDLAGETVIPGIIDSHTHFVRYATQLLGGIDLGPAGSLEEALSIVSEDLSVESHESSNRWIRGGGWDKNVWPNDRFPTRGDLDSVIGDRPAAFFSRDCHAIWVNTRALREAGIDRKTRAPLGGVIRRDTAGEPTGVLLDAAIDLVTPVIPPLSDEAMISAVQRGIKFAASFGITGFVACEGNDAFRVLSQMARNQSLDARVWLTIPHNTLNAVEALGLTGGWGNEFLQILGMKVMLDGSLGSQTAYLDAPYTSSKDGSFYGIKLVSEDELLALVRRAQEADLPAVLHAIGDAACEQAISVLEQTGGARLRHRLEHAQLLRRDHPKRMRRLGVVASVQPAHLCDDIPLIHRHWHDRSERAYPLASLSEVGVRLAFGSDLPVAPLNPFLGIAQAAFRVDAEGQSWHPEQRISVGAALEAYTLGSAYGVNSDHHLGILKPGAYADFVTLDRDPTKARTFGELAETQVTGTWVAGKRVYPQ